MWFNNLLEFEEPAQNELKVFVNGIRAFLGNVVFEFEEFRFLWDDNEELLGRARLALQSREMADGFEELAAAIDGFEPAVMSRHGLSGANLRFKFGVLGHISSEYSRRVTDQFSVRGWFERIVAAIDALLDSLIDAAAGAGGLIKEFKDALGALAISKQ